MLLKTVLQELFITFCGSTEWSGGRICVDSRKVAPGDLFVAIPGVNVDGAKFIDEAVAQGAVMVVAEDIPPNLPMHVNVIIVTSARIAVARLWKYFYGAPNELMQLFGVTGTNGKTTTVFLIHHLLEHSGVECGLLSTVYYRIGKKQIPSTQTTPEPETMFRLLAQMREEKLTAVAMELSSHALSQNRVCELRYRAAIFTNLSGDHLDYHKNTENYYQAKKRLFTELLASEGVAIINIDDSAGKRLINELDCRIITMGTDSNADWVISDTGVIVNGVNYLIDWPLPGSYNRYNFVAALIAVNDFGIALDKLLSTLIFPVRVPGRLEEFYSSLGVRFVVDYAHSDDALRNVLQALRPTVSGKLIVVFGAGGNRDHSKRSRMGAVAGELADEVIITSDNPRFEEPETIIKEILSGIPEGKNCHRYVDRSEAIREATKIATPGDTILVAGKGHENYQEIKGVRYIFDDRAIIKELIEA